MAKFYCKYCGRIFSSITTMTMNSCYNSPNGKHQPFEGGEQSKYYCKYCGRIFSSIATMTMNSCYNSPSGKHQPLVGGEGTEIKQRTSSSRQSGSGSSYSSSSEIGSQITSGVINLSFTALFAVIRHFNTCKEYGVPKK